mmetsp:Transcript_68100/g.162557  ORF Transcript_68100/g.162557 Transcript_68100/m.162557 type:complete len:373 (+) Transcript_68100:382-1500(+)
MHLGSRGCQLLQKWSQRKERSVVGVIVPGKDENAVVRLQHEVFLHVVNNEHLVQVAAQAAEILHEDGAPGQRVLAIQAMMNQTVRVDLVDHPVSIVLGCRRENDELVAVLVHALDKLLHARPDLVTSHAVVLRIVHQSLIKVEDQRERVRHFGGRQLGVRVQDRQHGRQWLEPNDGAVPREVLRAVATVGILGRPGAVWVAVGVQQRLKADAAQHLGPNGTGPETIQRHTGGQRGVDLCQHGDLRCSPEASRRARAAVARGGATAEGHPFGGGAAAELPHHVGDHLIVLPQRHDVLAPSQASIPLHAHQNVQVQILRAVAVGLRRAPGLLRQPTLTHQIQQYQAVLVNVVQQVPQPRADGHRDPLHGARAEV